MRTFTWYTDSQVTLVSTTPSEPARSSNSRW